MVISGCGPSQSHSVSAPRPSQLSSSACFGCICIDVHSSYQPGGHTNMLFLGQLRRHSTNSLSVSYPCLIMLMDPCILELLLDLYVSPQPHNLLSYLSVIIVFWSGGSKTSFSLFLQDLIFEPRTRTRCQT